MKVFISHQQADTLLAMRIAGRLRTVHGLDCYLDVIDPYVNGSGDELADHLRTELGQCTQLLAVVSQATQKSWWVPWEIGVATEKDYPLATYSATPAELPDYLRKWPYLRSDVDLDQYADVSRHASREFRIKRGLLTETAARGQATREFFRVLRSRLGQ